MKLCPSLDWRVCGGLEGILEVLEIDEGEVVRGKCIVGGLCHGQQGNNYERWIVNTVWRICGIYENMHTQQCIGSVM